MTWEDLYYLPTQHDERTNSRVRRKYGDRLTIDKTQKHPYLAAFKALDLDVAQCLPNFYDRVGHVLIEGSYQTVLDIYEAILDAIEGGFRDSKGRAFKGYVRDSFTLARSNSSCTFFLECRGYTFDGLIDKAASFYNSREQLKSQPTESAKIRLQKINEAENEYKSRLAQAEPKRNGKQAIENGQHMDDEGHRKVPLSKNRQPLPRSKTTTVSGQKRTFDEMRGKDKAAQQPTKLPFYNEMKEKNPAQKRGELPSFLQGFTTNKSSKLFPDTTQKPVTNNSEESSNFRLSPNKGAKS